MRAIRVGVAVAVLLGYVAVPAQLVPQVALAAGSGRAHGSDSPGSDNGKQGSSGSDRSGSGGGSSGAGGLGSRLKGAACGALGSIPIIGGAAQGALCSVGSGGGGVDPVQATSSILKKMFGGLAVAASPLLTGTLTEIPDYASQSGGVVRLERSTTAVGFGVLALVLTLSVMRFALAGISSSAAGGFEAVEGVTRTLGAALAVVAWPWAFHNLAAVMNTVTHAMLSTHAVHSALVSLVAVGGLAAVLFATGSKVGWVFGIVILGPEAILMIGLLLLKVVLSGTTTVIFVAMPLALTLWPLRETSWIAARLAHVLFVAVATPLMWAVIFATAAVMGGGVFGLHGGFWNTVLIRPLAALSMFVVALWAPLMLMRHAHGGIGHPVGRFAGYASMRLANNAVSAQLPERIGGRRREADAPVPSLELARELASGRVSGRQSLSVPLNGESAGAIGAFLDLAPDTATRDAVAAASASNGHDDRRGQQATVAVKQGELAGGPAREMRPAEDTESFTLRDPGTLSFAESLAAERVKGGSREAGGSLAEARAALGVFSPQMLERIEGAYRSSNALDGGGQAGGELDASSFRVTMAATALSDEISERQAGALGTLAGTGDHELGALFGGGSASRASTASQPGPAPVRADGSAPTALAGSLASLETDLAAARGAVPIAEQAPPPGRES